MLFSFLLVWVFVVVVVVLGGLGLTGLLFIYGETPSRSTVK